MVSFVVVDLVFLAVFTLFVIAFLYPRRKNLQRQGILYLYRTKFGLKVIDWTAKKFNKILKPMQYIVIACGYALMIAMIWMLVRFVYIYLKFDVADQIKVPPLLPLFPYATDLFKVSFLPPFYFTYWIIVIAIIAISHEFAHGIFAKLNKIKIKSTGFGFLGPFLAAFVEPDERQMQRAKKFPQLSILAAGTFANVVMTILFGIIMILFFMYSFIPAGVIFNAYGGNVVQLSGISSVNGIEVESINELKSLVFFENESKLVEIGFEGREYLVPAGNIVKSIDLNLAELNVYEDAPAVREELKIGEPITEVNGERIESFEELGNAIRLHNPGENVTLTIISNGEEIEREITLGERNGSAYLGIGILSTPEKGPVGKLMGWFYDIKSPYTYYEPTWDGDFAWFIYNLLWWIVLINISVALVNMLPVGIFDGGRFFYLTIWGITGKENWARKAFSFTTWAVIFIAIILMVRWAFAFF